MRRAMTSPPFRAAVVDVSKPGVGAELVCPLLGLGVPVLGVVGFL